ncbi:MAG: sigma-70 family RNA polymerase sigma factor [Flavobacteriales bacterium]|nr:sigma-70 family RNA polymerase sigma factor [Flavobacteriales bacterium]
MTELVSIVRACKKKKRGAQKALYMRFADSMMGTCRYYASDVHEAEDILQEGFMIVFKKIDLLSDHEKCEGWMRRIFINLALERHRRRRWTFDVNDGHLYNERLSHDNISPQIDADELLALVHELPPQYRMIFNLYAIEGYKHKEIADLLGISTGTSKSNLSRARAILQEKVLARYGTKIWSNG